MNQRVMNLSTQPRSPKYAASAVTFAALVLFPLSGSAASIAINSPTAGTSGAVIQNSNTFAASQVTPTRVKVTGLGDYTATGSSSVITLSIGGLISAEVGESILLDYDFSFTLTGNGQVNWTLNSLLAGFLSGPSDSGGPILRTDSGLVTGSKSTAVPIGGNNVPWSATLTANWTGAASGDTLAFNIPNNSIDIAVVPEPSSILLLGLGGFFFARRRR